MITAGFARNAEPLQHIHARCHRTRRGPSKELDRLNRLLNQTPRKGYDLHVASRLPQNPQSLSAAQITLLGGGRSFFIVQANQLRKETQRKNSKKCRDHWSAGHLGNEYPNIATAVACQLLGDALSDDNQLDAAEKENVSRRLASFQITD
jgi:hypothetical protein